MPDLQFPDAKNLQGMAERGFPFPADFDLLPLRFLPGLEPRELLRGLWDRASGSPQILVLTRSASHIERKFYGHHRMPALERPIYSCALIAPDAGPDGRPAQMELF